MTNDSSVEQNRQYGKKPRFSLNNTLRWPSLSSVSPETFDPDSFNKILFSKTYPSESYRHIAEQMNLEDLYPDLFESSFKKKEQDGNQSNDN